MKSGRSERSGSVVASSRAKRVNAEPVVLSSRSPTRPLRAATSPPSLPSSSSATPWSPPPSEYSRSVSCTNGCSRAHSRSPSISGYVLRKRRPSESQEALRRGAVVLERVAQDHVLHRVGGDDVAVVALGVGGEERLPQHLHADVERQQAGVTDAVHRHLELAVADARHATRSASRRRAILAISFKAVCSSSSGSASRRRAAAAMIESGVCSRAQTTNGKPKRSR